MKRTLLLVLVFMTFSWTQELFAQNKSREEAENLRFAVVKSRLLAEDCLHYLDLIEKRRKAEHRGPSFVPALPRKDRLRCYALQILGDNINAFIGFDDSIDSGLLGIGVEVKLSHIQTVGSPRVYFYTLEPLSFERLPPGANKR